MLVCLLKKLIWQNDFYNNCVVGATADLGPREPWHDCHAKVEGPAALDIMKNFEERW
jgi:phospholipase D1/2